MLLSDLLAGHDAEVDDATDEQHVPAVVARSIIEAGQLLDRRGWVPATSGNISQRLPGDRIAITRSGCHEGFLTEDDIMLVDRSGVALTLARPSAETMLHCQIYQCQPNAGAVLHGHSVAATVLSRLLPGDLRLNGYEVQKAFSGQRTHDATVLIPVFDNDQDIERLAATIMPHFALGMPGGYLIRGHGAYAWGADMLTALARLEALEFLLACEMEQLRHR